MDRADFIRESIDYMHRFMMKNLQKLAERHGITVPQTRVIAEVLSKQSMTIKQLTHNLKMTQSTVSDIVERLTGRGILAKTPDPKDKRSVIVTLTDKTLQDIKVSTHGPLNAYVSDVLSLLNPDEQATVEEGIRLLVAAIREKTQSDGAQGDEYFDILFLTNRSTT